MAQTVGEGGGAKTKIWYNTRIPYIVDPHPAIHKPMFKPTVRLNPSQVRDLRGRPDVPGMGNVLGPPNPGKAYFDSRNSKRRKR